MEVEESPEVTGGAASESAGTAADSKKQQLRKLLKLQLEMRRIMRLKMPKLKRRKVKQQCITLTTAADEALKGGSLESSLVVDSGTGYHIFRDGDVFEAKSSVPVRIRGVGGVQVGYKGTLKKCSLGVGIPAIHLPELPVKALLSTSGLKDFNWRIILCPVSGDKIENVMTGAMISLYSINKLPTISSLQFGSEFTEGLICSPVVDEDQMAFTVESMPMHLKRATKTTLTRLQAKHAKQLKEKRISRLVEHRRMCHFHEDGKAAVNCHECNLYKGRLKGHEKMRKEEYVTPGPFQLFATDFFGPLKPESYRGSKYGMIYICDKCGFAWGRGIKTKDAAPILLKQAITEIRRMAGCESGKCKNADGTHIFRAVRSDNEPVLKSWEWDEVCNDHSVIKTNSVPYCPQQNGTAERFVQSIKSALRTVCANVDPRLWDFALDHCIAVWNLRQKTQSREAGPAISPQDVLNSMSQDPLLQTNVQNKRKYLRRWGCLVYWKPGRMPAEADPVAGTALQPRRRIGVHLGFSKRNSAWLVGTLEGGSLSVYETRSVTFFEDILVSDLRELDRPSSSVQEQLSELIVNNGKSPSVGAVDSQSPAVGAVDQYLDWDGDEENSGTPGVSSGQRSTTPTSNHENAQNDADVDGADAENGADAEKSKERQTTPTSLEFPSDETDQATGKKAAKSLGDDFLLQVKPLARRRSRIDADVNVTQMSLWRRCHRNADVAATQMLQTRRSKPSMGSITSKMMRNLIPLLVRCKV